MRENWWRGPAGRGPAQAVAILPLRGEISLGWVGLGWVGLGWVGCLGSLHCSSYLTIGTRDGIKEMELSRMDTSQSGQSIISSSSHFPPNFPVTEPVFYIPRVPQILDAHEPVPPKKPPPPGYDLKTLRKQVEYLQEEINERVKCVIVLVN
eukprot:scaffold6925_cov248-Ochromonas_danica.AAC.11